MDKKGTDKILSIYWFAVLIIIAAGIFIVINLFYNSPYDVREIEANLLANKVADCVSLQGRLTSNALSLTEDNFLEICNLNFAVEDELGFRQNFQYYVDLEISEVSNPSVPVLEVSVGNLNFEADCEINNKNNKEKLVTCIKRGLYAAGNNDQYLIKISSAVRKTEKNVK